MRILHRTSSHTQTYFYEEFHPLTSFFHLQGSSLISLHSSTDCQPVNMDSLKQIDALTDNIIDMYIPMMDLADMSYDFHREQGKLIATECEEIISKLLNLIAVFMKKTTCMRNKDLLKHYYNRYHLLKFCGGKLDNFAELNMKLQETFIYSDMEIYIMKICSKFQSSTLFHFWIW